MTIMHLLHTMHAQIVDALVRERCLCATHAQWNAPCHDIKYVGGEGGAGILPCSNPVYLCTSYRAESIDRFIEY
jgi:hypothetical protein